MNPPPATIGREENLLTVDMKPFLNVIDERVAIVSRLLRRQQQPVVPAGIGTGDRARRKSLRPFVSNHSKLSALVKFRQSAGSMFNVHPPLRFCAALLSRLLDQLGNKSCPSCLVAGPDTRAVIAVKILIEKNGVSPEWIFLELLRACKDRPPAGVVPEEDMCQPPRQF